MLRFSALIASLRLANAPSVVSNVWLGYMLGWAYWGGSPDPYSDLAKLISIGLCLYFAGNLANDWFDRRWDAQHRPERALPAGHFSPITYLAASLFLAANGILSAATVSYPTFYAALAILVLIVVYTVFHKRSRWAVLPMGMCRAGLYLLGFGSAHIRTIPGSQSEDGYSYVVPYDVAWTDVGHSTLFIATHALGLLIYIAGLTLAARYENSEHPPHGMVVLSRAMLFLPVVAMSAWWMPYDPGLAIIGLLPFVAWLAISLTRLRSPVPRFVSALLAGIPLIDFIAALPLAASRITPDQGFSDHPLLLATILVPLAAFALSLLLQRTTPAT